MTKETAEQLAEYLAGYVAMTYDEIDGVTFDDVVAIRRAVSDALARVLKERGLA